MKPYLKQVAIFAAIYLLLVQIPTLFLPYYWGNEGTVAKIQYLNKSVEKYNTYFLGASTVYRQIDPAIFDTIVPNSKSFNLGYAGFFNPELYPFALNFIENSPSGTQTVFLEMQPFQIIDNVNVPTVRLQYNLSFDNLKGYVSHFYNNDLYDKKQKFSAIRNGIFTWLRKAIKIDLLKPAFAALFNPKSVTDNNSLGYQNNGYFNLDDNSSDLKITESDRKGLLERKSELQKKPEILAARKNEARLSRTEIYLDIDEGKQHLIWVNKLMTAAKSKNIHLVFVLPPRLKKKQYQELLPVLGYIGEKNIIDLADPKIYPDFYDFNLSFDIGHLNKKGVPIYTKALAENMNRLLSLKTQ